MSEICKLCMHTDIKIKQYPCNACDDAFSMFKSGIEQQLQQAHRSGWEQAKREAQQALCEICCYNSADNPVPDECTTCNESRAIAALKYKEPTNER